MANLTFNGAKGKVGMYVDNVINSTPANAGIVFVALKAVEGDSTLPRHRTLTALLADAANTECDFDNYGPRKTVTTGVTWTIDDVNNHATFDTPDQEYTNAGGTQNNDTMKILVCYDPDTTSGNDDEIVPLIAYDFVETTNGNNLTAAINANGLMRFE